MEVLVQKSVRTCSQGYNVEWLNTFKMAFLFASNNCRLLNRPRWCCINSLEFESWLIFWDLDSFCSYLRLLGWGWPLFDSRGLSDGLLCVINEWLSFQKWLFSWYCIFRLSRVSHVTKRIPTILCIGICNRTKSQCLSLGFARWTTRSRACILLVRSGSTAICSCLARQRETV